MSDPNQPYGAIPPPPGGPFGGPPAGPPSGPPAGPPSGPPAGPPSGPPSGPPAGPPAGQPSGPPPYGPGGGGSGGKKGLWIALGVVGVLALVGLVVALVLVLTGDDDKDGKDDKSGKDPQATSAAGDPVETVEALIAAAQDGDCDAATELLVEDLRALPLCESEDFQFLASTEVSADVGDAAVEGGTATVPVEFTSSSGSTDYTFTLEQVDDAWLVSGYDEGSPVDHPTDPTDPTDDPTDGTTDPTDGATDPTPGGTSTADSVDNTPEAVVAAFIESVYAGDCATAEDLVTEEYLQDEGSCEMDDVPTDLIDQVNYDVGAATITGDTAKVTVEFDFAGSKDTTEVELTKVGGLWRISDAS